MSNLFQDIQYGIRMLVKNPGFTAIAVMTLALGIGVNTAIFSVVNLLLINPMPFKDGHRIVYLWRTSPRMGRFRVSPTREMAAYWQQNAKSFESLEPFTANTFTLTGVEEPESLSAQFITPNLFSFLDSGISPKIGRGFHPDDIRPGAERVAMIGEGLWQRQFGGDPQVVGRKITLNDEIYTVVGVMPLLRISFFGDYQLWMPLSLDPQQTGGAPRAIDIMARLKPGVSAEAAQAELDVLSTQMENEHPRLKGWRGLVITPQENVPSNVRSALPILFIAAGFVLLIACANVANLLMSRNNGRSREIAIRMALGASRFRLIRQLLSESLLLSLLGGGLGVLLALWSIDLIRGLRPETILQLEYLSISREAFLFNLSLSILTGILFGLAPALQASRVDLNNALKQGAKSISAFGRQRFVRNSLVVGEVTLALVLLVGAGLLIRSLINLQNVERGFDSDNLMTMQINLPETRYPNPTSQEQFFENLLAQVRQIPGVQSADIASEAPPNTGLMIGRFDIEGRMISDSERPEFFGGGSFGTDYFKLMGIPLLEGRTFNDQDNPQSPSVVIINEAMAKRFWPDKSPVGERFRMTDKEDWLTIIGVVGDVRIGPVEDDKFSLQAYYHFKQAPAPAMQLIVRSQLDQAQLIPNLKARIRALDDGLPVKGITSIDEMFSASLSRQRFNTLLLTIFSWLALALAAIGIYGVMSYTVTQRTHEIGIRMALGARRRDVLKMIVRQGIGLAIVGVAIGLAAAFALTRLMSSLLFGIGASDPFTFGAIALLLVAVALLACYVPARRATKVDPMVALRYE